MKKDLSLSKILEIFKGLEDLRVYLGVESVPQMFTKLGTGLDKETREKYNRIAEKNHEFITADRQKRADLLGVRLT